jgi:hypothetical protein
MDKVQKHNSFKTKPLQVDDLIINKSLPIFEASRRILTIHIVKISVLVNTVFFLKHHVTCPYSTRQTRSPYQCVHSGPHGT